MKQRRLIRHARKVVNGIDIPYPFSAKVLGASIAKKRNRPLYFYEIEGPSDMCGMWLSTTRGDHIFFEPETSRFHQDHIILHELGHMLCGHLRSTPEEYQDLADKMSEGADGGVIQSFLGRTSYTSSEEQAAEMVASLILEEATRRHSRSLRESDQWLGARLGITIND